MKLIRKDFIDISNALADQLNKIDYESLNISNYNKDYIRKIKPALHYIFEIYANCLYLGINSQQLNISKLTIVDYGGGSGFLSMLAKKIGIGKVIYIDINPSSIETVKLLKQLIGVGPDIILQGDSKVLLNWSVENEIKPQLLIATDVIEHIYDLECFFDDLYQVNKYMYSIFTTSSNPYNPYSKSKLRKMMHEHEKGSIETPNYLTLRKQYIQENYPTFTNELIDKWAVFTRGLIFDDIDTAILTNKNKFVIDSHNTCDPRSGSWYERILSIKSYRSLLIPYEYKIDVLKGFYFRDRKTKFKSVLCSIINWFIGNTGKLGLIPSPFIILYCKPIRKDQIK